MKIILLLSVIFPCLQSCTIYRSPDRKDFESASPQFRAQNLKALGCSNSSLRNKASASRLVTIYKTQPKSENNFLWEYIIDQHSYFEADNLNGTYCTFTTQSENYFEIF